jgi:hypothetical protein
MAAMGSGMNEFQAVGYDPASLYLRQYLPQGSLLHHQASRRCAFLTGTHPMPRLNLGLSGLEPEGSVAE